MPFTEIGKTAQSAIYRAGTFGRRPKVPTDGNALEEAARRAMSRRGFAYVAGSAGGEATARANRAAFDRWQVVPRMLVDTSERDLGVELFGRRHESPLLVAPIGVLSSAHADADLAVARAAREQRVTAHPQHPGVGADGAGRRGARWLRALVPALLEPRRRPRRQHGPARRGVRERGDRRHPRHGMLGWRPRDLDLGHLPFARGEGIAQYTSDPVFRRLVEERVAAKAAAEPEPQPRPTPAAVRTLVSLSRNHPGDARHNLSAPEPSAAVETFLDVFSKPALSWADLPRLRELTRLPVVLKGVLHPDDARQAVAAGVDGILVSNHGGRQVDRSVAALDALPGVVDAVREAGSAMPVLFDSGIRSGADAFVALALGADAVGIGRPHVYGLALAGAEGVAEVLRNIRAELDLTMALTGCRTVADVTRERLVPAP